MRNYSGIKAMLSRNKDMFDKTDWEVVPKKPKNWDIISFRRAAELVLKKNDDKVERQMLSLSSYNGIEPKKWIFKEKARPNEESSSYLVVKPGQLVVNPMWVIFGAVGISEYHGIVSPAYRVYNIRQMLDPNFANWLFRSFPYVKEYNRHIRGLTTYDRSVKKNDFNQIPVLVPPMREQKSIVAFLDRKLTEIDRYIAAKKKLLDLVVEQNTAIISKLVTEGMGTENFVSTGLNWFKKMPAHWQIVPAKFLCKKIVDCKNRTPVHFEDGEYVVVRTSNVKKRRLVLQDLMKTDESNYIEWTKRGAPRKGDVLFTREAPAGEACLYCGEPKICLGQRMMYFRCDTEKLLPEFLLYSIYGKFVSTYIELKTNGSTVGHLRLPQVYSMPILLPPLAEQRKIVRQLANIENATDKSSVGINKQITLMKEFRTALIADAVTGKIDVTKDSQ